MNRAYYLAFISALLLLQLTLQWKAPLFFFFLWLDGRRSALISIREILRVQQIGLLW